MSIQIDNGEFTRLHNTIFERLAVARLTASEYRCLFFLFRMTYGWQKKEDVISLSQWAQGTGTDPEKRHNALRTLQGLVAKGVIYCKPNGNNHPATWGFNKNFEQWDASLFDTTVIAPDNTSVIENDNKPPRSAIKPDNTTVISTDNTSGIKADNSAVITPDNHQRKTKETIKKGKEKPRARSRSGDTHPNTRPILDAYVEALGYKPGNYGQESSAAKQLATAGYEPSDVVAAYLLLKQDPFWKIKHLSLQTLVKEIQAMKHALVNGASLARAPANGNGHYMSKGERQNAAADEAFRILREKQGVTVNEP